MRFAVISDIHSNWEALTAVFEDIRARDVSQVWCLGDLVGYNADPDGCVERVRAECTFIIGGNHDGAAAGNFEPEYFNRVAREAVLWTRHIMKRNNLEYLKGLPSAKAVNDELILVHGAPSDPDTYIMGADQAEEEIHFLVRNLRKKICFFGHTHVPVIYGMEGGGAFRARKGEGEISLSSRGMYLINPGSVGQPRDGDPRASYLVFDAAARSVEWFRVSYDIAACQGKIYEANLPAFLAHRLERGC